MSDKPRFVAKVEKTVLPQIRNSQSTIQRDLGVQSGPIFDLTELNLLELSRQLKETLNAKPSGFIFFKQRHNRKLQLETEKLSHIINIIDKVRTINQSANQLKAELFLSQSVIENIINGFYLEAERQAELKASQHINELVRIEDEMEGRRTDLDKREIANLKDRAEVDLLHAKTQAEKMKALLMQKAVDNFDNLPQSLQVYVIRAVFNPGDKQEDDILLQEQVREYLKMEKEASAKKADYEAERMKDENEFRRWKQEENKKKKPTT